MEKNVGHTDKLIRYILAIVAAYFGYQLNSMWLYLLAVILLLTAWMQNCFLYKLFGINTMPKTNVRTMSAPVVMQAKKTVKKAPAKKKAIKKKKTVKKK